MRRFRRDYYNNNNDNNDNNNNNNNESSLTILNYHFNIIVDKITLENKTIKRFIEHYLFLFVDEDL